jgi:phosphatidylglycerophosphatase C
VPRNGPAEDSPITVAAFDFDGTLTRGGSVIPFLVRVRGPVPVTLAVLRGLPRLVRAAIVGGRVADDAKQALFARLLSGLSEDRVDEVAAAFAADHVRRRARPEMRRLVDWHRSLGHRIVVVSASPECYVKVAAALLGADAALATRLQVGGGLLTGQYEGQNCRGAQKYARLIGWMRTEGMLGPGSAQPVLWAYGNSRGDLRLLEAADHGVDAGRLGRLGRLRRFTRLTAVLGTRRSA